MTLFGDITINFLLYTLTLVDWGCRVILRRPLSPLTEESLLSKFTPEEKRILFSETLTRGWWYEGFSILVNCFREDRSLSVVARYEFQKRFTEILQNRLALTRRLDEVTASQCPIKRPIFIIGHVRSGTTFLLSLLNEDPQNTAPKYFELMHPVKEEIDGDADKDARMLSEASLIDSLYSLKPELKKIHHTAADKPHECYHLMDNIGIFKENPMLLSNSEVYNAWLRSLTKDQIADAYRFHKVQMQMILLDRNRDGKQNCQQLIFKDSIHAQWVDAIINVYPDALFVHTYRDPCVTSASASSLVENTLKVMGCRPDLGSIRQQVLSPAGHGGNEMVKFRKEHPELEHRFCDIDFDEIVASPMEVVRKIYDSFGMELTAEGEAKMSAYVKENPQNKHGRHTYDLKRYNITEEVVYKHFDEYLDFFKAKF